MKIDRGYNEYKQQINLANKQNNPAVTQTSTTRDHVAKLFDFSSTAQQIAHPTTQAAQTDQIDHAKLMAIRSQITQGKYQVDIEQLATKLTTEMHDQQK